jgi:hypothetical protein
MNLAKLRHLSNVNRPQVGTREMTPLFTEK